MAQHDYVIANGTGAAVRSDLNNALAAIVSQNSGATAPSPTYAFQWWADTTTGLLKLRNAANSGWITLFQLDGEWSTIALENGTAGAPSIYFKDSGTDTGFYSPGTDQVGISTGGTARLTIDANGNVNIDSNTLYVDAANNRVGLGTSSPAVLFHLSSASTGTTANSNVIATVRSQAAGRDANIQIGDGTDFGYLGSLSGNLYLSTANVERVRVDTSGRVGIGTTSPSYKLDTSGSVRIKEDTNKNLIFTGGISEIGSVTGFFALNDAESALVPFGMRAEDIRFATGSAERARIDSSGRLLIGTSSSLGTYLTQINFAGSGTNGLYVNSSSTSGDGSTMLAFVRASTPNNTIPVISYSDSTAGRFELRNNGGLANYSANNVNLSDRNSKKDISPATGTWDCLKEWEIVNFRYKDQPDDADLNLGVIAQQVAESCPEVITVFQEATEDQPEKLGVKDQQMMWMAIKALQEAQLRIEELEAKVAALEAS